MASRSVPLALESALLVTEADGKQVLKAPLISPNVVMTVFVTCAVTVLPPSVEFAVTSALAWPLLPVVAVVVLMPGPEKVT